jgi:hypothetical protein
LQLQKNYSVNNFYGLIFHTVNPNSKSEILTPLYKKIRPHVTGADFPIMKKKKGLIRQILVIRIAAHFCHIFSQAYYLVAVAKLVIIPHI